MKYNTLYHMDSYAVHAVEFNTRVIFHEMHRLQLFLALALVGLTPAEAEEAQGGSGPLLPGHVVRAETSFLFTRTATVSYLPVLVGSAVFFIHCYTS